MKRLTLVPAIIISLAMPATAQSQTSQFYLQLDGGASFLGDSEEDGVDFEYDAGYVFGGRIGAYVAPSVRVEGDVSYSSNEFDSVNGIALSSAGLDADFTNLTFGVGAYVDLIPTGIVDAYLGAGIGAAYKEIETNFGVEDDGTDLMAHGEVGVSVDLTPSFAVVPHYRLLWLDGVGDDEQFAHWLRLGLRYSP